ncbi:hypothetical protein [Burkholderia territorii]|uniref:hypothetical protein n=1 Tax=Burkholderia territorii TaxID=1503055 RepID=UPI0012D9A8FD|nr:hypothetical protein [Burkholderia territorii]
MDAVKLSGQPLFRASGFDSTIQSVVAVGGEPQARTQIQYAQSKTSGVCYDYTISGNGRASDYYVAFNKSGMTTYAGFTTCAEANRRGIFQEDIPVKQVYCRKNPKASVCQRHG